MTFLLVGMPGDGKSATGNSILRLTRFVTSSTQATTKVRASSSGYKGWAIKVVDCPAPLSESQSKLKFVSEMKRAMGMCPEGFDAFILVHRYGFRFKDDDQRIVDTLKSVFGDSITWNHTVLVVTCGDQFESKEEGSFEKWCEQQQSCHFGSLMRECNNRVVLFDNETKMKSKMDKQLDQLISHANGIRSCHGRYTRAHFHEAKRSRDIFEMRARAPVITERVISKLSSIENGKLYNNTQKEARAQLRALADDIKAEDQGTGNLDVLLKMVEEGMKKI